MGTHVERHTVCTCRGSNENELVPTPDDAVYLYTLVLPLCMECFPEGAQCVHGRKRKKAQQFTMRKKLRKNRLGNCSEEEGDSLLLPYEWTSVYT